MTRLAALLGVVAIAWIPASAQTPPLTIVLLIDVTASVSRAMAPFIFDGRGSPDDLNPSGNQPPDSPRDLFLEPVDQALARHVTADTRVRVGSIARSVTLGPDFSADPKVLRRSLEQILDVPTGDRHGPTPLWDGVDAAIAALESTPGRRVVILITDGMATGNRNSLRAVIERARQSDVSVSVIVEAWRPRSPKGYSVRDATNTRWAHMIRPRPLGGSLDVLVRRLADETGGIVLTDGDDGWPSPGTVLDALFDRLRGEPTGSPRP